MRSFCVETEGAERLAFKKAGLTNSCEKGVREPLTGRTCRLPVP